MHISASEDYFDDEVTIQFKDTTQLKTECYSFNTFDDLLEEGPETLTLTLDSADGELQIDPNITITITIIDDECEFVTEIINLSRSGTGVVLKTIL